MDDDEIFGRTIYFQLDDAADCFGIQGYISHKKGLLLLNFRRKILFQIERR